MNTLMQGRNYDHHALTKNGTFFFFFSIQVYCAIIKVHRYKGRKNERDHHQTNTVPDKV